MFNNAVQDIEALTQLIQSFGHHYKIQRKKIVGINDRGRLEDVKQWDTVFGVVQPYNKRINTNNDGKGRWVLSDTEITVVNPEYVSMGDIIKIPGKGNMIVISIQDYRDLGAMVANLIRTGTTDRVSNRDNIPYEPT